MFTPDQASFLEQILQSYLIKAKNEHASARHREETLDPSIKKARSPAIEAIVAGTDDLAWERFRDAESIVIALQRGSGRHQWPSTSRDDYEAAISRMQVNLAKRPEA